jgi:hypothetical protein
LLFAVLAGVAETLPAPRQDVEVLQVRPNLYMIAGAGGISSTPAPTPNASAMPAVESAETKTKPVK